MYKLSIIIPIYNVENYIQDCLESVLTQLPENVQIICVNDGSPDSSIEIAERLVANHSHTIQNQFLFLNQSNKGLSAARNKGLESAEGEYIGFLDSDDRLCPNYFESILPLLETNEYDIIDFDLITAKGNIIKTRIKSFDSIFNLSKWFCPARVFKASLFHNARFTNGILYEDVDLTPKLYLSADKTTHINAPLYWYRVNESSITKSFSQKNNVKTIESLNFICDEYLNLYSDTSNPYFAMVAIHTYYLLCVSACRRFNLKKSIQYMKKYKTKIQSIKMNSLPIEHEIINKNVLFLYYSPKTFCYFYALYDSLRNIKDKIR